MRNCNVSIFATARRGDESVAIRRAHARAATLHITAARRGNSRRSHIRPLKDGGRFLLIVFKVVTLYSPLKLFFPVSTLLFLMAVGYYAHTFLVYHRFTNMGTVLFSAAIVMFWLAVSPVRARSSTCMGRRLLS